MLILARVELSAGNSTSVDVAVNAQADGADFLHIVDVDADVAGAPQNVQTVHQILNAVTIPVQFRGGVSLVHTAELILGLGVARVVLDDVTKTERSPSHFFRRLGDTCLAVAADSETLQVLAGEGCSRVLYDGLPGMVADPGIPIIAAGERNLPLGDGVSCEGVVVEPARVSEFARGMECCKQ